MDSNRHIDMMQAMLDDDFQTILENDPVLDELEKAKYDPQTSFFELMMILSKTFTVDGVVVSCITPAIWAYLYSIGSPYATDGDVHEIDTDIMLYVLHNGIRSVDRNLIDKANGFCASHRIDPQTAEADLKMLIYLSFRPLEMLPHASTQSDEKVRFDADWLTHLVSIVCPLVGKTSDEVIYDTSVCECMYYMIQRARENDAKGEIRRRNSDEINEAVYIRTMELGREYWEQNYGGRC
jgi:hypothetical protein